MPRECAHRAPELQYTPRRDVDTYDHRMKKTAAFAAPALLLTLTACGGSSSASPTTVTVTETSTATATETTTETETASDGAATETASETTTEDNAPEQSGADAPTGTSATDDTPTAGGGQVDMAVSSARNYLQTSAFSRQGLIDQLSSEYGEKYPLAVATKAVDSLTDVDWNAQAVKSAKNYLSTQSFSCAGLTEQLSSSYGEKFTASQAAYGASQTSACK